MTVPKTRIIKNRSTPFIIISRSIANIRYWKEYSGHEFYTLGARKKTDQTIYTFDIETTSLIEVNGILYPASRYLEFSADKKNEIDYHSTMYIWQFGINDQVYYGRSWDDFILFLERLEENNSGKKLVFVHNLSFEFAFFCSQLEIKKVFSRKSRKVIACELEDYNIEFRCSLMMSNCSLDNLAKIYKLPIRKQVGDLDYDIIRNQFTELTEEELRYCEYDCLVVYEYIKLMAEEYGDIDKIPKTSTGQVRGELKELVRRDFNYKRKVYQAVNTNPHIFNLLLDAFAGGYTHANWIYSGDILEAVDSWDLCSSYPASMVLRKYPSTDFRPCKLTKLSDMVESFAYLVVIRMTNVKSRCWNNFISYSKCREVSGARLDNGRIIEANELEITLTDVDLRTLQKCYDFDYEILESYFAIYQYLPIQLVNFILDKYVQKTIYKGQPEYELELALVKSKFNAIYGMCVTNEIRPEVTFSGGVWEEHPLTNEDIVERLKKQKNNAFLSFAYGVWVTAWSRNALIDTILENDDYVVYSDTDSNKNLAGYDKKVYMRYNDAILQDIKRVSKQRHIPEERFAPKDIKGKAHPLGVFEYEGTYDRFITLGAKKYATETDGNIEITVAGVPKKAGGEVLSRLEDFQKGFVFSAEKTQKKCIVYLDSQEPYALEDCQGHIEIIRQMSGACLIPSDYTLGITEEYLELMSTERQYYIEHYNC